METRLLPFAVMLLLLCSGCAPGPRGAEGLRPLLAPRVEHDEAWQGRRSPAERERRTREVLESPLSVDDALQLALLNNPTVAANVQHLEARRARAFQEAMLQNPQAGSSVLFGGEERAEIEAELSFDVATLLHLSSRRDVARASYEGGRVEAARVVVDLLDEVRRAYFDVVAANQRLELERQILEATQAAARVAQILYEAGNITEFELFGERANAAEAGLAVMEAETTSRVSRLRLRELMGLGEDVTWDAPSRLPEVPGELSMDQDFSQRVVERSLGLDGLNQDVALASARRRLASWRGWLPGLEVGVASEYDVETERWRIGPSVSLALPFFDRRQHERDALHAEAVGLGLAQERERRRLRAAAERVEDELRLYHQRVRRFEDEILPLRARVMDEAQRQFNAMEIGIFELLDVRQAQMRADREYVRALHEYWRAHSRTLHMLAGGG